ncbi:MAG: glycosyltransferase [Solobacterium sp.]|nr:glycosyltransferase [Solobacterium sp.]
MKLISFAIPCYNSAAYMEHCIKTLLTGGSDIEIIIVDDGSKKDSTAQIADAYAKKYPDVIKAVHQENGGHGEAVNTGLKNAEGQFFKVVDSDDWVSIPDLKNVLDVLRRLSAENRLNGSELPDMFIANYVYDKVYVSHKKVIRYTGYLPENRIFTWDEAKPMPVGKYILMHSVIYRTEVLRESGLQLPKHTFYVDNIYVTAPLPYVKKLYYMNADLYHYYIGREDQSVNETVMKSRIDQQLRVNKIMVDDLARENPENPNVWRYMRNYLDIITNVSGLLCVLIGTEEAMQKKDELWEYIRNRDDKVYKSLYNGFIATAFRTAMRFPSPANVKIVKTVYGIARKIYGFN